MPFKNLLHRHRRKQGFALIITISLMILLALLATGLLTLSTVALRSGGQTDAMAEARANARLALIVALGELQRQAGPDQRITAPADLVAENAVQGKWTGVWGSWTAGESAPNGNDEESDHATIPASGNRGMSPSYEEKREDHFRGWLASLGPDQQGNLLAPDQIARTASPSPAAGASEVSLVSRGTLGETAAEEDTVAVGLQGLKTADSDDPTGRLGWWIGDESTKARLLDGRREEMPSALGTMASLTQASGSPAHERLPGFSSIGDESVLALTPTRESLQLLENLDAVAARSTFHSSTPYSRGLLCDVREGGLKRDLSGLLSRPISTREISDEFMLYRFGRNADQVPIQDLAAYYQLYKDGVESSSRELRRGIQIKNPDFGRGGDAFTREYTNLYRLPVPIKVQFLLSMIGVERTAAERRANPRNPDTHKLHIGITPAVTYWNPYNVPLVMNLGADNATQFRFFNLPMAIRWTKEGTGYTSRTPTSLAWIANGAATGDRDTGFTAYLSGSRPVLFEPGQVRVFSLANTSLQELRNSDTFKADRELVAGWDPGKFIELRRSERTDDSRHVEPPSGRNNGALTFTAGDRISFEIAPDETIDLANGSALQFFNRQSSCGGAKQWMARQYQLVSRMKGADSSFNRQLMELGMPDGQQSIEFEAKGGRELVSGEPIPFLLVNLTAGCETSEDANSGPYGGRHFASRPFLHSSPITGTVFIDRADRDGMYQHGWNWWVEDINSVFEANVSTDRANNGYYGGGYTAESGSTHIIQQEIPIAPPISIAALSHAQLGGFSLANAYLGPGASNTTTNFQETTASGQGGLFPQTVQAIGNSYAHPYLPADQAHGSWMRQYVEGGRGTREVFADHSYLANKALWDEYFFSSITDATGRNFTDDFRGTAREIAERFFFEDGRLLNPRFTPHTPGLTEEILADYFSRTGHSDEGIDAIASRLMVEGPFNVNSTSVDAWRAVFSSLRETEIPYLDADSALGQSELELASTDGTPATSFSVAAGQPTEDSSVDPADPDQWRGARVLTDTEIDELAEAMVEQVRLRGPFLSLSEFINRRLDADNKDLALKGALQAALDDPDVSINEGFRESTRQISSSETGSMSPEFPEALEGPVAYGSAAYVDQADVLRGLAGQLTPRGDTFVIRTYGDALDRSGRVVARAWCEAVVQRVPEYLDPQDEPHLKQSELQSAINERFGRRFELVSFRYLRPAEV